MFSDEMCLHKLNTMMTAAAVVMLVMVMMSSWKEVLAQGPCCGPRQWAAEVRLVTMEINAGPGTTIESWHWVSYDLDRRQVGVINFDPHSDFYQRELLDYTKGKRYLTPDEVQCSVTPLTGSMKQLCVPPSQGVVTEDVKMHFGVYPEPSAKCEQQLSLHLHDGLGLYAETIYYTTPNVTGYVTVASLTCSFVNEMTYASKDDGSLQWSHTQWNNITLFVDDHAFIMPDSCHTTPEGITTEEKIWMSAGSGLLGTILRQP